MKFKGQLNFSLDGSHVNLSEKNQLHVLQMLYDNSDRPKVVCVCGSTKFKKEFEEANKYWTCKNHIVLTVGFFAHADGDYLPPEAKENLDKLHFRKIDMCDFIYVVNPGGYIGKSTQNEIEYARKNHKPVSYLE